MVFNILVEYITYRNPKHSLLGQKFTLQLSICYDTRKIVAPTTCKTWSCMQIFSYKAITILFDNLLLVDHLFKKKNSIHVRSYSNLFKKIPPYNYFCFFANTSFVVLQHKILKIVIKWLVRNTFFFYQSRSNLFRRKSIFAPSAYFKA